ncbi:MAG: hypothetical protein QY327_07885 [Fimbriimonadaceae bacterium]|nr:MAG: hypothetical protein UZ18_ATM001000375 [Armatimonadetes bacterium OLB18]WKZ79257.1 MAG: hypothetical protein QY327_07885 [Fimbriimonadaceae bacterium]
MFEQQVTSTLKSGKAVGILAAAGLGVLLAFLVVDVLDRRRTDFNASLVPRWRMDSSRDPQLGSRPIPSPVVDVFQRSWGRSGRPAIVVAAGGCSDCSRFTVDPHVIHFDSGYDYVMIYRSPVDELVLRFRSLLEKRNVFFLSDLDGVLHTKLNARFTPRVYLLDDKLRLLACQSSPNQNGLLLAQSGQLASH